MMNSNQMRSVITKLCPDFQVKMEWHRTLTSAGYMPLHIEVIEQNIISVMHTYRHESGDVIRDPDVLFWADPTSGDWFPVSMMTIYGIQQVAQVASDYSRIESFRPRGQRDLATFCNTWARNIRQQFREL